MHLIKLESYNPDMEQKRGTYMSDIFDLLEKQRRGIELMYWKDYYATGDIYALPLYVRKIKKDYYATLPSLPMQTGLFYNHLIKDFSKIPDTIMRIIRPINILWNRLAGYQAVLFVIYPPNLTKITFMDYCVTREIVEI